MVKKRIGFLYKGKKFKIKARKCGFFSFGLMFRSRNTMSCLFEFKKDSKFKISSLFVFFPFVAIWLGEKNKIVDFRVVKPFNFAISSKKPFKKLVEIPINKRYDGLIKLLVGD